MVFITYPFVFLVDTFLGKYKIKYEMLFYIILLSA